MPKTLSLKDLRSRAIAHLLASPFLGKNVPYTRKEAVLDVDVLLCFLLHQTKAQVLAHLDENACKINEEFKKLLEVRYHGVSLAYITKEKEFYGLTFYVNPSVLIPKPDTEVLVEASIKSICALQYKKDEKPLRLLDVFSGSGCVGIATVHSLLSNLTNTHHIHLSFVDISNKAIEVSLHNAKHLLPFGMQGVAQERTHGKVNGKTSLPYPNTTIPENEVSLPYPSPIKTQFSFFLPRCKTELSASTWRKI